MSMSLSHPHTRTAVAKVAGYTWLVEAQPRRSRILREGLAGEQTVELQLVNWMIRCLFAELQLVLSML